MKKHSNRSFLVFGWMVLLIPALIVINTAIPAFAVQPTDDVALHAKVTFSARPNYKLCTDSGDTAQITDGKLTNPDKKMWAQKGSVGWSRGTPVTVTLDLGKVQPISGVGVHVAAGISGGVHWPRGLWVFLSDDGKVYHAMGDLLAVSPAPAKKAPYHNHWFKTDSYQAHGRYVKIVGQPGGSYFFTDEIRVYRGDSAWLGQTLPGSDIQDVAAYFRKSKVRQLASKRVHQDIGTVRKKVSGSSLLASQKKRMLDQLDSLRQRLREHPNDAAPTTKRQIMPFNDLDAGVLAVWGRFLAQRSDAPLMMRSANLWNPMQWIDQPGSKNKRTAASVWAMRNETRSVAVNLTNATGKPMRIKLSLQGLNLHAGLAEIYRVAWTDTAAIKAIATALIPIHPSAGGYLLTIPAGVTQQVWLTFKPTASGRYTGKLVATISTGVAPGMSVSIPLHVNIFNLNFPAHPHLHVGGWDYTNTNYSGVTDTNRKQVISLLQRFDVDTPWATNAVLPFGQYDRKGNMVEQPDMTQFDQWLALWPHAARYAVFMAVKRDIDGLAVGTNAFKKAVKEWADFVAHYVQSKGIKPSDILLLYRDEPFADKEYKLSVAWADAAAGSGLTAWTDPVPHNPDSLPRDFINAYDAFCFNRVRVMSDVPAWLKLSHRLMSVGKSVEIYGTKGPAKEQDPYAYYRLQAWRAWTMGADCSSFWALTDNRGVSDWKPYLASSPEPYTPIFLDKTSATPAKQLVGIRAGVEDYEYLYMLKQALANAKQLDLTSELLDQGHVLLHLAAKRVLNAPGIDGKYTNLTWSHPKNRFMVDQVRIEIGKWLEKVAQ